MYLEEKNYIKLERDFFKNHGSIKVYIYKCSNSYCDVELRIQQGNLKKHKGKCGRCSQRGKPFMASYNELVKGSKRRGMVVDLTYEEYVKLCKIKTCFYCGKLTKRNEYSRDNKSKMMSRAYMIDRRNPKIGYTWDNCVSCCTTCNFFKANMDEFQFLNLCKRITEYNFTREDLYES